VTGKAVDKAYDRPTTRARELRNNATDAERQLWHQLSARKVAGTRFNRQVPIGPFICDFVARSIKLVIEVDGSQHERNAEADQRRTKFLEAQGYKVIRFWNNDVIERIEGVLQEIERVIADMPSNTDMPSPDPSRKREGRP
jgi:very-short-patch-repair endonuclease